MSFETESHYLSAHTHCPHTHTHSAPDVDLHSCLPVCLDVFHSRLKTREKKKMPAEGPKCTLRRDVPDVAHARARAQIRPPPSLIS